MKIRGILNTLTVTLSATACLLTAASSVGRADGPVLTGRLLEHIDGTNPITGLVLSGIGLSASPTPTGNEVGEALGEFVDPRAAMAQLEALKHQHGYSGGRVFVGFTYDSDRSTELNFVCGVSPVNSNDYDEVRDHGTDFGIGSSMSFRTFKQGSRAERVRAIARCLASMTGMPKLKPTHPDIKRLYIDESTYHMAETWLRALDPPAVQGSRDQYREAFRCIVADAARALPDATGDSVVLRMTRSTGERDVRQSTPSWLRSLGLPASYVEKEDFDFDTLRFSVLNDKAARATWDEQESDRYFGLWPSGFGAPDMVIDGTANPIEQALGKDTVRAHLAGCRRRAKLFELPPARVPEPALTVPCTQR